MFDRKMDLSSRPFITQIKYAALCAGFLAFPMLFAQWYVVSGIGYGGMFLLFISSFLMLPLLLALPAIPVAVLLTPFRKTRRIGITILIFGIVFCIVCFTVIRIGRPIRMSAFDSLAVRSQSIVKAISRFNDAKGHPPTTLQELVPEYLSAIPSTGIPSYPNYEYSTESNKWDGNPWVLYVNTPFGMINWDMFVYFPLQNYPREGYGGSLERIRDWAYVHE